MKVLFCAQDPGGANVVIPVFLRLRNSDQTRFLAAAWAADVLRKQGIEYTDATNQNEAEIAKELASFSPEVIVEGTSSDPAALEKKVTRSARELSIKTISVIDFWGNHRLRYGSDERGQLLTTDIVCVVDERLQREAVASGISPDSIRITGSPYLFECGRKIRCDQEKNQVLFLSQPLSDPPYNTYPFGERAVLTDLLQYPARAELRSIIIKPHPKEPPEKFFPYLTAGVTVAPATADLYRLLSESRLVLGMNTIVLVESAIAGKRVISYQPGITPSQDKLGTGFTNIRRSYSKEALYRLLDSYRNGSFTAPPRETLVGNDPTEKIIALIKS